MAPADKFGAKYLTADKELYGKVKKRERVLLLENYVWGHGLDVTPLIFR